MAATKKQEQVKSVFETLNDINVNDKTEKKNNLTYLSWAWAWTELKKVYPDAEYEIIKYGEDEKPYLFDKDLGYMVSTEMTIEGITHEMWLPVMDNNNKAMKNTPYTYKTFKYVNGNKIWNKQANSYEMVERVVNSATMFDINSAIMRCLVKNIGMFGLGLYIYAGEDLPEQEPEQQPQQQNKNNYTKEMATQKDVDQLKRYNNLIIEGLKHKLDFKEGKHKELLMKYAETTTTDASQLTPEGLVLLNNTMNMLIAKKIEQDELKEDAKGTLS